VIAADQILEKLREARITICKVPFPLDSFFSVSWVMGLRAIKNPGSYSWKIDARAANK
jgi:hypothetical protein